MYEVKEVNKEYQHIRIAGYSGKWSAFEKVEIGNKTYYIFEHDFWGDETCYLVVRYAVEGYTRVVMEEAYETYDGIIQCLIDEDIIGG